MSRGLGRVELRILEILAGSERLRPAQIAFEIAGRTEPTVALAASVRRALTGLRKKGRLVSVMGDWMLAETWQWRREQRERGDELARRRETQEPSEERAVDERTREDGEFDNQIDYRVEGRRLSKILALLGSPHEGEVLNAARHAEQIRRRLRLSWEEMITLPGWTASGTETEVETTRPKYGPNFTF